MLHPLTLSHFLLLPALLILPLSAIMALPLVLIGFPFMLFMEVPFDSTKTFDHEFENV